MNMGSTGHQSTKTTQWTVDRLADQINSVQSNQPSSQKVSNQPTCKKVSQDSCLLTQLITINFSHFVSQ